MQFQEDSVSDFILYKLNNPQALEKEMKLIEDRKEYMQKLQEYGKQMEFLKNELSGHNNILDTLTSRRNYLEEIYTNELQAIEGQIQESKEKLEHVKKQTRDKRNSSDNFEKKYEQFQRDIVIKKQKLIENHDEQLTDLDRQTEELRRSNEQKIERKECLLQQLKKLKERQKIITGSTENVQKIKNKWQTRHHQLEQLKEEHASKQKQIDDLTRYSRSMEKVIYSNLYKRVGEVVNDMIASLDVLYGFEQLELKEPNWEEHLQEMFIYLKVSRQKMVSAIKQKREKYKVSASLPEPDPHDYNYIVQTKINPQLLVSIDSSNYTINNSMYLLIEQGQNSMLDDLQRQRVQCQKSQKEIQSEIMSLQRRINQFEQQIQIKRRAILSPIRKRK